MASNIAHQVVKVRSQSEKSKFIKWLENLEFGQNKIPKPDLVILLTIPTEVAQKFMRLRKLDIHEKDIRYQMLVAKAFEEYARTQKSWAIVSNMVDKKLRSLEDVHLDVVDNLSRMGVF